MDFRGGRSDLFVSLVLIIYSGIVSGSSVECPTAPCFGNRPTTENGCCLGLRDEPCGNNSPIRCDVELGYTCADIEGSRETCQGLYNLRAVDVQYNNLTIQWDDFKPYNYSYEYSILYTMVYNANFTLWTTTEKGIDPQATLTNLRTSQIYFIRVAVWEDPFERIYGNISETLVVKTKIGCIANGKIYQVNDKVKVECEERCTCTQLGEFRCEPLTCGDDGSCEFRDMTYKNGERFQTECLSCGCSEGRISCINDTECLTMEPSEECSRPVKVVVPGQCCPSWNCSTDCVFGEMLYRHGDEWADGCDRMCWCLSGRTSCESLCQEPDIPENCTNPVTLKDERNCCDVVECRSSPDECVYDGRSHRIGDMFHAENGCSLCACTVNTTVMCSVVECPNVRILEPSAICPEPQIQNTGCCRQQLCGRLSGESDVLKASVVNAISQSPVSFTVSFVPPSSLASSTLSYKLKYAKNTNSGLLGHWLETNFVKPVVQSRSNTTDFLGSFFKGPGLVEDRIYMTVENVYRNTTYIVQLYAIVEEPVEENNEIINSNLSVNHRLVGLYSPIAVTTMLGENMCLVGNEDLVSHGAVYKPNCRETCVCDRGELICEDPCEKRATILIPSRHCPKPRLEHVDGQCCPQWKCYPEDGGCMHGGQAMRNGERIREGCEHYCTCNNGNLTCESVCGQEPKKPTRENCHLDTLPNQCCPTWMCLPDKKPFVAVETKLKMTFQGSCSAKTDNFKSAFAESLINCLHKFHGCLGMNKTYLHFCDPRSIEVRCLVHAQRRKRSESVGGIEAEFTIFSDLNGTGTYSTREAELLSLARSFAQWVEEHGFYFSMNNTLYSNVGSVEVGNTSFVCSEGYLQSKSLCVQATPIIPPTKPTVNITLSAVDTSSHSFTVGWREISISEARILKTLYLEFKQFAPGTVWNRTEEFSIHKTTCTIDHLHAAVSYNTRLVMLSTLTDIHKLLTNPILVTTEPLSDFENFNWEIKVTNVDVDSRSATIDWNPPSSSKLITAMELTYTAGTLQKKLHASLDPMKGTHKLSNLSPSTYYVLSIEVLLRNGTVLRSGSVHTKTNADDNGHSESHKVIITAISIVAAIALVLLIALSMLLWRRHCLKGKLTGLSVAFENKVFFVQTSGDRRPSVS